MQLLFVVLHHLWWNFFKSFHIWTCIRQGQLFQSKASDGVTRALKWQSCTRVDDKNGDMHFYQISCFSSFRQHALPCSQKLLSRWFSIQQNGQNAAPNPWLWYYFILLYSSIPTLYFVQFSSVGYQSNGTYIEFGSSSEPLVPSAKFSLMVNVVLSRLK